MKKHVLLVTMTTLILVPCSSSTGQDIGNDGQDPDDVAGQWSIPVAEVLEGGPGRDGIPALTDPALVTAGEIIVLQDTDLVLGFKVGENIRAYPHIILDWHEIINDNIGDVSLAVTYCPLTGTGIGWDRIIDGNETTFGVSGLLYNTNLIPFDRATESNWSQILNESVNGELQGKQASLIMLVETDWGTWKNLYPETEVVGLNTGFSRTYGTSPYGDYNTNNDRFLFPVAKDGRLPLKERVHAIVDGADAKAYRFGDFDSGSIILDSFNGSQYMLVGNADFIVSFVLEDGNMTEYEYVYDGASDVIVQDSSGNRYTIFGEVVAGPLVGQRLTPAAGFMGFWFSIPAFYETVLYEE